MQAEPQDALYPIHEPHAGLGDCLSFSPSMSSTAPPALQLHQATDTAALRLVVVYNSRDGKVWQENDQQACA